ncbi:MAG TPA: hypothetical protein VMO47_08740 [Rhodothermales bacterium]|nr:hypothetical protein [Rhodothermales bacterium]
MFRTSCRTTRGFVGLVLIAALIVWPVAYFALDAWLSVFAA